MSYELRQADEGVCPACEKNLDLLTHREMPDGWPCFLICFGCKSVTEVKGDSGETVVYKRGRRKKFTRVKKDVPEAAKKARLREHQKRRESQ